MNEEPISIWRFLGAHNEQVVSSLYDKAIVGRITFDTEMSTLREWIEVYRDRAFDDDVRICLSLELHIEQLEGLLQTELPEFRCSIASALKEGVVSILGIDSERRLTK